MDTASEKTRYAIARQKRQSYVDDIVDAQADKKLVVAGPGTGKTYLFKTVLDGKKNTLTLTFVNALVADLSLELYGLSDVKTLHSFARAQLEKAKPEGVKVFPKLSEVIKEDAGILLGDEIDFDYLFRNRVDEASRLRFYKKRKDYYGHYGFSDLIYAAVQYFERKEDKIPTYEQVVVDEFQDFNALEVSLIDLLASKSPVLLAGDDDQALYETLTSASAKYIRERHAGESAGYRSFTLPYCSRSTRVIVDATNDIIRCAKEKGLLCGRIDKQFEYFPDAAKDQESDSDPHIVYTRAYAKQVPWFIHKQVSDITRKLRKKFTVLVLSPTRVQCRSICAALKTNGFENVQFADKAYSAEPSLLDGLKLLLANRRCNLGWRIVSKNLLDDAEFETLLRQTNGEIDAKELLEMINPGLKEQVGRMLTALRRVRDRKDVSDDQLSEVCSEIDIDPFRAAAQSLRGELASTNPRAVDPGIRKTSILVTTIQSSKGLAADYVFIAHFDDQYFVRGRDKHELSDENVCSFLVALTRARRKVFLVSTVRGEKPTFLTWIDEQRICEVKSPGMP